MVNNAALTSPAVMSLDTDVTDIPLETWNQTLQVNLTGYMLCSRRAIPLMAAIGGGKIVNTASGSGLLADASRVAYGASKAAIISLTQYIGLFFTRGSIRMSIADRPPEILKPRDFVLLNRHQNYSV